MLSRQMNSRIFIERDSEHERVIAAKFQPQGRPTASYSATEADTLLRKFKQAVNDRWATSDYSTTQSSIWPDVPPTVAINDAAPEMRASNKFGIGATRCLFYRYAACRQVFEHHPRAYAQPVSAVLGYHAYRVCCRDEISKLLKMLLVLGPQAQLNLVFATAPKISISRKKANPIGSFVGQYVKDQIVTRILTAFEIMNGWVRVSVSHIASNVGFVIRVASERQFVDDSFFIIKATWNCNDD